MRSLVRLATTALLLAAAVSVHAAPLDGARQLIVVTSEGWDSTQGQLQAYVRDGRGWHTHGQAFPVALGRTGSAWGLGLHPAQADGPQKQEGDGRSPAGIFALGSAFGYAVTRPGTAMPYQPMLDSSYCMDVPDSPFYNRIVDEKKVGSAAVKGSTEPMRLDLHNKGDVRYQEGFMIAHNPDNQPGKGSCIFAHLWRTPGEATAGCTAMPQERMQALMNWLRPQDAPRFVLLPRAEYKRLQAQWQLPALSGDAR
ncbi:L,D-transpeptidase family protein [Stenotrophomonas maltophilia]|uniref:L,D-transpeptidase family protein n=1 Tax=Stenotrophomonas maltophilia TaxID=40324 RepID=UPI0021C923BE|nr:L,D-transpeptidase family protein [Stenotrophomonas maltophilia]MCU1062814.1 L,D-transpeptidase family protein [Stenotrophomonas maltophilia]